MNRNRLMRCLPSKSSWNVCRDGLSLQSPMSQALELTVTVHQPTWWRGERYGMDRQNRANAGDDQVDTNDFHVECMGYFDSP